MVQHADIDHTGITGTGSGISNTGANLSVASQTIAAAATATDLTGCSVSLVAGTWIIFGSAHFKRGSTDSATAMAIADAANAYYGTSRGGVSGTGFAQAQTLHCHVIVTPAVTTTYKLRGTFVSGTTGLILNTDEIHGSHPTKITAIRLA